MSYGLEVSSQGVPLRNAADYQKVLDTRWELLEIEADIPLDFVFHIAATGYVGNTFLLTTHKLGHPAAFEFFPDNTASAILKSLDTNGFSFTSSFGAGSPLILESDDSGIYVSVLKAATDAAYDLVIKGILRVYKNDITQEFKAPVQSLSTTPATNDKIGVRIAKTGKRVKSSDTTDFALNTDARPIGIHRHGLQNVGTVTGGKLTITHDAGYRPTYYVALYSEHTTVNYRGGAYPDPLYGKKTLQPLLQFINFASADSHTITMRGAQAALAGTFAYLILKDPVDLGL